MAILLGLLVLTGCDSPTSSVSQLDSLSAELAGTVEEGKGVSAPGTGIEATTTAFTGVIYRTPGSSAINPANNALTGTCLEGGYRQNSAGNISGEPHPHCILSQGSTVEVNFGLLANFVQPKNGNINLNFSHCGFDLDAGEYVECAEPAFIHYQKNQDRMNASGMIYSEDGSWSIDLSQIHGEAGNLFSGSWSAGPFVASNGVLTGSATISW